MDFVVRLHHYFYSCYLFQGTVQQYIDDLFLQILKVDHTLPPAIKYLYDFLDTAARETQYCGTQRLCTLGKATGLF